MDKTHIEALMAMPGGIDVLHAQYERWQRASRGFDEWATLAKTCVEFFEGDQWTAIEKQILKDEGRPCITRNKIAPLVRLMFGFFRQNRYDIRYLAGSDGTGTDDIADILTGLAKQVAERNRTNWNDAQVFQDGLQTGRGFWDLRLNFAKNRMGEISERVIDPFSIKMDDEGDTYDPTNWNFYFEDRWMSLQDIFLMYSGRAVNTVMETGNQLSTHTSGGLFDLGYGDTSPDRQFGLNDIILDHWETTFDGLRMSPTDFVNRNRKLIRVLDCQHKELCQVRYFIDLQTGQEKIIPDEWPREKIARVMNWAQSKNLPIQFGEGVKRRVRWTVTAADRVLFDNWSIYDDYTLVPYFPYFRRGKTKGMIEDLLDPQREINRRASSMLHIIMSTANSGWLIPEGSMEEEMERSLEQEGARPGIHIKYKPDVGKPERIMPATTPGSFQYLKAENEADLKAIAGVNDSALGELDRVQSGKAVEARQRQSVMGAETYFDNFSLSRELKGRAIMEIAQRHYTEERLIRVRGASGKNEQYQINQRDAAGEIVNNISVGSYDIAIDEAPISATFKNAQFEEAMDMVEKGIQIPQDIIIELSSVPRKEEIIQRMEEQRMLDMQNQRVQALGGQLQLGIPPGQPVPPIVTDGQPAVQVVPPQQQPMPGQPPQAPMQPMGGTNPLGNQPIPGQPPMQP